MMLRLPSSQPYHPFGCTGSRVRKRIGPIVLKASIRMRAKHEGETGNAQINPADALWCVDEDIRLAMLTE